MTEILREYYALRDDLEARLNALRPLHTSGMVCRKGCSRCCMHLSLLPVEISILAEELNVSYSMSGNFPDSDQCPFLKEDSCSVYSSRPVICRAFGFPQLWITEEWDIDGKRLPDAESEMTVDWCELNFPDRDPDDVLRTYGADDLLFMTPFTRRLNELNSLFLRQPEGTGYQPFERYFMGGLVC